MPKDLHLLPLNASVATGQQTNFVGILYIAPSSGTGWDGVRTIGQFFVACTYIHIRKHFLILNRNEEEIYRGSLHNAILTYANFTSAPFELVLINFH